MKKIITLSFILLYFQHFVFSQDQQLIDSLQLQLKNHNASKFKLSKNTSALYDTTKANILYELSKSYRNNDPTKSIELANQSLALSQQINYKKGIGNAFNTLGVSYHQKGEFTQALDYYKRSLEIRKEINDKKGSGFCYTNIGGVYFKLGSYPLALQNHLFALKISEEIDDQNGIAGSYNNIGTIYMVQKSFDKALKYLWNALEINKITGNKQYQSSNLDNIGNIYMYQYKYADALKQFEESLKLLKEIGDLYSTSGTYINIGDAYTGLGNFAQALKNYFEALKIVKEVDDKDGEAYALRSIGITYLKKRDFSNAVAFLNKGLLLAKEIGDLEVVKTSYEELANIYSQQNNYKLALMHYKLFISIRDSMYNEENAKKTVALQMQYEFDKKENLAKVQQEKKDVIVQEHMEQQKIIRNSFVVGSILLILLIGVLINRNKLKRTAEMEKMRFRLSRDLHDDIGSTLSSINILSRTAQTNLAHNQDEKTKESLEKINERSQRLLDNMSDIIWNINPGNDTIEEVMSRMREYATTILEAKNIDYTFNFPREKIDCKLSMEVKNNMYLIFKEALNNLSKYSGASKANLSLTFDEKNIHLKIEDNGKGFNEDEINHRGGLSNMKHRAEEIKGSINIIAKEGIGVNIELVMPRYC
jgi:signal transduction histidine kinase